MGEARGTYIQDVNWATYIGGISLGGLIYVEQFNGMLRYHEKYHILVQCLWTDHLFITFEENLIFPYFYLRKIFSLKYKFIFSRTGSIIFPDNTRKIVFQCNFFRKMITVISWASPFTGTKFISKKPHKILANLSSVQVKGSYTQGFYIWTDNFGQGVLEGLLSWICLKGWKL